MDIWHKNNEKPITYKMVVMEFDRPFPDIFPDEEHLYIYECYEMGYCGDGKGKEWEFLKKCTRWAYLNDLISDNEEKTAKIHILTESQMNLENTIGELGQENEKLKNQNHNLKESCEKLKHENDETMREFKHINKRYANSIFISQQRADCIDELKKQLSEHKEYCCCQKNEVLILENKKLKDILKECQIILQETQKDRGVYLNNLHLTDTLIKIEEEMKWLEKNS